MVLDTHKGNVCPDGAPGSRAPSFWSQTTTTLSGGLAAPPVLERTLCLTTKGPVCSQTLPLLDRGNNPLDPQNLLEGCS